MTNRFNLMPKFGIPIFENTNAAGLSAVKGVTGSDRLYLFAIAAANTTVAVRVWGRVKLNVEVADEGEAQEEAWILLAALALDVGAAEVNAPAVIVAAKVRGTLKTADVQACDAVAVELVSASATCTIWAAGAQAGF